ncbi:hypothetical protein [Nocardia brasiliensis]|uniref:hypothetical protein n=1 Tax=Nocardia brasiliensis TaxID=37326 RepID=UPI00340AE4E7
MKHASSLAAAAGLLFGVAAGTGSPAQAAPDIAAGRIVLTNNDNGHTTPAKTGDTVEVKLRAIQVNGQRWVWDEPRASDDQLLSKSAGRVAPNGDAQATFDAVDAGRGTITAHRRCVSPKDSCPQTVHEWTVTVDIQ